MLISLNIYLFEYWNFQIPILLDIRVLYSTGYMYPRILSHALTSVLGYSPSPLSVQYLLRYCDYRGGGEVIKEYSALEIIHRGILVCSSDQHQNKQSPSPGGSAAIRTSHT